LILPRHHAIDHVVILFWLAGGAFTAFAELAALIYYRFTSADISRLFFMRYWDIDEILLSYHFSSAFYMLPTFFIVGQASIASLCCYATDAYADIVALQNTRLRAHAITIDALFHYYAPLIDFRYQVDAATTIASVSVTRHFARHILQPRCRHCRFTKVVITSRLKKFLSLAPRQHVTLIDGRHALLFSSPLPLHVSLSL